MKKKTKVKQMKIYYENACGIDIGSTFHVVGTGMEENDVKQFGVYTKNHKELIAYLKEKKVSHVAMESTGSYWQSLFNALQKAGFDVLLADGNQTKVYKRKTDVKDARGIYQLHSLGLLDGCFLPDDLSLQIRNYYRHRNKIIEENSRLKNRIQKDLRLMNIRLDNVLADIFGKSGRAIIEEIIKGNTDPIHLASFTTGRIKKTKEEIANGLEGQWDSSHLYLIEDNYNTYKNNLERIIKVDAKLKKIVEQNLKHNVPEDSKIKKKRPQSNQINIGLETLAYGFFGVDLFAIDGVSHHFVMTLMSEIGSDGIYKFPKSNAFTSFLGVAPNYGISGGKKLPSKTKYKRGNQLTKAFLDAAHSIGNSKQGRLKEFHTRMRTKHGRTGANKATARKLAVIVYHMLTKKTPYQQEEQEELQKKKKLKSLRIIQRNIKKHNLNLEDLQYLIN